MPKKNNKKYQKSLHQQAYERLNSMTAFGQSRQRAKQNGTDGEKIFSYATYHTYSKHIGYYFAWLKSAHPNVTTLKKARKYVSEWLQQRVDQGLSAHTIRTEQAALNKLFGIKPDDKDYFIAPKREREKIKRSRTATKQDAHFSTTNNAEIIAFGRGTGLRKNKELAELRGGDKIDALNERLKALDRERKNIYNRLRRCKDKTETKNLKERRDEISAEMKTARSDLKKAQHILKDLPELKEKIIIERETQRGMYLPLGKQQNRNYYR